METFLKTFHVRVNHELGFFSFYYVEAYNYHEAEREAEKLFVRDFCNGEKNPLYKIETFTFNKYLV